VPSKSKESGVTIETRQLRYFIAVAEERHFGRAAERLRMAQPPLSQQIKQLEGNLGVTLLNRTTRNIQLTPAGDLLLARGRRIIDELNALEANVMRVGTGLEGIVHVGFTGAATYGIMPRVVRDAAHHCPGLVLDVSGEHLTPSLVDGLLTNKFDVAVLRPPVVSTEIEFVKAKGEPLVAAVSAQSDLASRDRLTLNDFAGRDFVGYPTNSTLAQSITAALQDREIYPRIIQTVSETSTLLSLVAAGIGISLVPESATAMQIGGTVYIPVEDAPEAELAVAWRRNESTPAVLAFITFLKNHIKEI
jgi:DNA-binding transcriptional LysR family regulator